MWSAILSDVCASCCLFCDLLQQYHISLEIALVLPLPLTVLVAVLQPSNTLWCGFELTLEVNSTKCLLICCCMVCGCGWHLYLWQLLLRLSGQTKESKQHAHCAFSKILLNSKSETITCAVFNFKLFVWSCLQWFEVRGLSEHSKATVKETFEHYWILIKNKCAGLKSDQPITACFIQLLCSFIYMYAVEG